MQEYKIESFDGTPIHCYVWDEVENPKAIVQIVHGMAEHAGRYAAFAEFLNKQGYIVFGDDHRAHGKTELFESVGHHEGDIYEDTLNDIIYLNNYFKTKYKLPTMVIGHSYGSFLSQGFLQRGIDVKGVILCGSAYMGAVGIAGAMLVAPLHFFAAGWRPKFVNKMSDVIFNRAYKGEKGASLWITRDAAEREKFIADPLSGIDMSINFDYSMIKAFSRIYKKANLAKLNPDTPIGIFSGTMDPIGGKNASKAVQLQELYKNCGVKACELHLYDGARHELLNETNREEVFADMLVFINKCFE
ncbi:MAG: alpha/beta hydrolase [Clostridia bacterium]|nr:alpha/beta hydrolase [Clostridia bacterium]